MNFMILNRAIAVQSLLNTAGHYHIITKQNQLFFVKTLIFKIIRKLSTISLFRNHSYYNFFTEKTFSEDKKN